MRSHTSPLGQQEPLPQSTGNSRGQPGCRVVVVLDVVAVVVGGATVVVVVVALAPNSSS